MTPVSSNEHLLIALIARLRTVDRAVSLGVGQSSFIDPKAASAFAWLVDEQARSTSHQTPTYVAIRRAHPGISLEVPAEIAGLGVSDMEDELRRTVRAVHASTAEARVRSSCQAALTGLAAGADVYEIASRLERDCGKARPVGSASTVSFSGAIASLVEDYQNRALNRGILGIPTPFPTLTRALGGWQRKKLYAFLGLTSAGKSWLVMSAASAAYAAGHRVLVCLGEMTREDALARLACMHFDLSYSRYRQGRLTEEEEFKFFRGIEAIPTWESENNPIQGGRRAMFLRDATSSPDGSVTTIAQAVAEARRLNVDLVLYDSVYKAARSTDPKDVNELADSLLRASMATNVPWIVSSQLNDSGAAWLGRGLEKDAEAIMHVSRGPHPDAPQDNPDAEILGIEITKNRSGGGGRSEFGVPLDPGTMREYPHPISVHHLRQSFQARERARGRYGEGGGTPKSASPAGGARPPTPGSIRP